MQKRTGLLATCGLNELDGELVRALADEVRRVDGVLLKLEAERAPEMTSDFCWFDGGRLAGYASLDGIGSELEVTAAVSPPYRRRGIFRQLVGATQCEAQRRGAKRLLLVNYSASSSGTAAVQRLGFSYVFSEYRMESVTEPPIVPGPLRLITVGSSDVDVLSELMLQTFGETIRSPQTLLEELQRPEIRYFLAEVDGRRIGQIGVLESEDSLYFRAFGIVPEYRQRGHGRQLLSTTVRLMLSEGHRRFELDVATDNDKALTLYKSCGFYATNGYEYYDIPLICPAS